MEDSELKQIFSRNLKKQLELAKMSQKELSERAGVSTSMVSLWCKGENVPRTGYLAKLTQVFNCTMTDLLLEEKKKPRQKGEAPPGYDRLSPEKKAIVDALILQLAAEQQSDQ